MINPVIKFIKSLKEIKNINSRLHRIRCDLYEVVNNLEPIGDYCYIDVSVSYGGNHCGLYSGHDADKIMLKSYASSKSYYVKWELIESLRVNVWPDYDPIFTFKKQIDQSNYSGVFFLKDFGIFSRHHKASCIRINSEKNKIIEYLDDNMSSILAEQKICQKIRPVGKHA